MKAERGVIHAKALGDAGIDTPRGSELRDREVPVLIGAELCADMFGSVLA